MKRAQQIAGMIFHRRRQLKTLCARLGGKSYADRVAECRPLIRRAMDAHECGPLEAVLKMIEWAKAQGDIPLSVIDENMLICSAAEMEDE